jgi:membrane protease YdiL (CAAX protease family)
MTVTSVPRFPIGRSIGLFFTTAIVALAAMFFTAIALGIAAGVTGQVRELVADFKNPGSAISNLTIIIADLAAAWFVLWRYPRITHRSPAQLGLRPLRQWDLGIVAGAVVLLFVLRLGYAALILVPTHNLGHVQAGFNHYHTTSFIDAVFAFTAAVVSAPFAEELLFRMVLFGALAQRMPVVAAALISAVVFAAIHGDLVYGPLIAMLGFVNAIVYYRTHNIIAAMLVHGANNALAIGFLIASGGQ